MPLPGCDWMEISPLTNCIRSRMLMSPRLSSKIVGYNLYRSFDAVTWKKINVSLIASTLYSDSTVANGTTHYYAATAVDINGRESRRTVAVKAVVP